MTYQRKEVIGDATLYLGDCLDVLPMLCGLGDGCQNPDVSVEQGGGAAIIALPTRTVVDAVITDPPYGVDLGKHGKRDTYASIDDTERYLLSDVIPRVSAAIAIARRAALTCGNKHAWHYPKPDDWGIWYNPAGTGCGKWGFILAHMILYYGIDPHARKPGWMASSVEGKNDSVAHLRPSHPCPKPEMFMRWLVGKGSVQGETVLDPFMGSGTTGVACMNLGRKFIGIEIEPKYFDIAVERITNAQRQERLFA